LITIALLIALANVPQSALDAADAANLAHTRCMFVTMRQAGDAHVAAADLERNLKSACSAEERDLREASTKIFSLRGHAHPSAEADAMIRDRYRSAVEQYRRQPEIEQQLRGLEALCKADPKSCN